MTYYILTETAHGDYALIVSGTIWIKECDSELINNYK